MPIHACYSALPVTRTPHASTLVRIKIVPAALASKSVSRYFRYPGQVPTLPSQVWRAQIRQADLTVEQRGLRGETLEESEGHPMLGNIRKGSP